MSRILKLASAATLVALLASAPVALAGGNGQDPPEAAQPCSTCTSIGSLPADFAYGAMNLLIQVSLL